MSTIDSKLAPFREAAKNPAAVLDKHIANGKKVVGVGPYYAPEELIYAAGAEPFGIWGMVGAAEKARKYFSALLLLNLPDDPRNGYERYVR
ncbi:MAG: hypothetical protein U0O24_06305 [Eggerthellaceae bacterium]